MKRIISAVLIFIILGVSSIGTVFAEYGITAKRSRPNIYVNGEQIYITAYNINGNNYFMLRDLAKELNGTSSQFDASWDSEKGQVVIATGQGYKDEEDAAYDYYLDSYIAHPSASPILVDNNVINITAYNINSNNYFKLRDLADIIPFYVDWVEEQNSICITTRLPEGAHKSETDYQLSENGISYHFGRWSDIKNSYLVENDDGTISVIDINDGVNIETYDKQYNLIHSQSIAFELPLFGAFYSGDKYNYIAYGQENSEENDKKEVIRLVKYNKDFTKLDSVSVNGGESYTILPFSASAGRIAEQENKLVFHTGRKRYTTEDGLNHQSQLTLILDTNTMTVLNDLGRFQYNHVSHSFNQFVIYDDKSHVLLDHGDAYPRSVVLHRQKGADEYAKVDLFMIPGEIGANYTGISIGGFEMSSDNYIAAINSINQNTAGEYSDFGKEGMGIEEREVILCLVPKKSLNNTSVKQVKITNYIGTDRYASIPKLVKINEDKFMVLWQEILMKHGSYTEYSFGDLKYLMIDGSGKAKGEIKTQSGAMLSNCDPILLGNQVVWHMNQNGNRIFYTVPVGQ